MASEGANAQQPAKKPENYQSTDYASITDIIKEREGKSVKVPIAAPDPNIPNNGSTGGTEMVNGSVVAPDPGKRTAAGTETVGETSNLLNRKDEVEEGNDSKSSDELDCKL